MRAVTAHAVVFGWLILVVEPVEAQSAPTPPTASEGVPTTAGADAGRTATSKVVYDAGFFTKYNVQNAEDMLRRIPGVSAILDAAGSNTQARGFGSGGDQILVMGRRFPGKANEITKTLRRLRAASIERIDLIRGASDDIDVQSEGVVVNLILKEGETLGGGGNYDLNLRGNENGRAGVDGLFNYAGSMGRLGYNGGVERAIWSPASAGQVRWSDRFRDESYRYPNGAIQEARPQNWRRDHDKWIGTAGLTYDLPGGSRAQLNGLYEWRKVREIDTTPLIRYAPSGAETLRAVERHVRDNDAVDTLEIGGEYRVGLARGELTALFIVNRINTPTEDVRTRQEPTRLVEVSRSAARVRTGEDIARLSYSRPITRAINVEVGAEGARNTLRQTLDTFFDLNGDGRLEAITIPTADARVKELRGEAFANLKWSVNAALSLNGSLNYEFSNLTTNSAFNPGRTLSFLKPRLDARYKASEAGQLRLLVERTISQLDFANFVPAYNVLDDRVDSGNPGLLPERAWALEAGYEHRLARDAGVLEARIFYQNIMGPIDRFPLRQGGVLVSAQGNLDRARLYGAEGKASVRLVPLGLPDAVVSLRGLLQNSSVVDPFTGLERRLRSDRRYALDVGFRHDVTAWRFSYGVDYKYIGAGSDQSDLFSRDIFRIGPLLEAFAERRLTRSLVLRVEAQNLLGSHEYRDRTQFLINQIDGRVRRLDRFDEIRDRRYAVRLRGAF